MDAVKWLAQFNLMLADRGEMEDFTLLEPKSKIEEMRKQISSERRYKRRDVTYNRLRLDAGILEGPDGAVSDRTPTRSGKYSPDDYFQSRGPLDNVTPILKSNLPRTVIAPGAYVKVNIPGHFYHGQIAVVLGHSKNMFEVEIISKLAPKTNSKGRLRLNRQDLELKEGWYGN